MGIGGLGGCMKGSLYYHTAVVEKPYAVGDEDEGGKWSTVVDEDGYVKDVWIPSETNGTPEQPELRIVCSVRPVAQTQRATEKWANIYENAELTQMRYPTTYKISEHSEVTDIRDPNGQLLYAEADGVTPTSFSVESIDPVIGPFGTVEEYNAILKRMAVQP